MEESRAQPVEVRQPFPVERDYIGAAIDRLAFAHRRAWRLVVNFG
jgi:hypothetical protein